MHNDSSADWSIRTYGPAAGSHVHDHYQVLWGLQGALELDNDGRPTTPTAGSGIVVAPHERHDFESHGGSRCLLLDTADQQWSVRGRVAQFATTTDHLARFIGATIER